MGLHLVLLASLGVVLLDTYVSGHGGMIYPNVWQDLEKRSLDDQRNPYSIGCGSIGIGNKKGCLTQWFTNNTVIPGESVIPAEVRVTKKRKNYPWDAPGTAPTLGGGCGLLGGNPDGCAPAGASDDRPFGSCCGGYLEGKLVGSPDGCGGFSKGEPAAAYNYPNAATKKWKIGSSQKVAWFSKAHHAGGYSYRLCKLDSQGQAGVTEECFQKNVLDFAGNNVLTKVWPFNDDSEWVKTPVKRTREGTFPAGSQWTMVPFPGGKSHTMMDKVVVPTDLSPGQYVLSFRWDAERTPQVWNGCSNIELVN